MSTIRLQVEVGAGCELEDACKEALLLANKLGITVEFEGNDSRWICYPDHAVHLIPQKARNMVAYWKKEDHEHPFIFSNQV